MTRLTRWGAIGLSNRRAGDPHRRNVLRGEVPPPCGVLHTQAADPGRLCRDVGSASDLVRRSP